MPRVSIDSPLVALYSLSISANSRVCCLNMTCKPLAPRPLQGVLGQYSNTSGLGNYGALDPYDRHCDMAIPLNQHVTWSLVTAGGPLMGVLLSHVDFKKCQCSMSLLYGNSHVPCQI